MKNAVFFLAVTAVLHCLFCTDVFAQYADDRNVSAADDAVGSVYTGRGQGFVDTGKTLMFTGASVAVSGLAVFVAGSLTFEQSECCPETPVFPLVALAGGVAGAAIALVGLPFYSIGARKMENQGGSHMVFDNEAVKGFSAIMELGFGMPGALAVDGLCGYDFNKTIFLGGGIGYKALLGSAAEYEGVTASVPVYANARFSFGDKRVVPYVSPSIGYDMYCNNLYIGLDTGTRLRCAGSRGGTSWWLGTKIEMIGKDMNFLSLKLARSF